MIKSVSLIFALGAAIWSAPADACSPVVPRDYEGSVEQVQDTRHAINQAALMVDGEVVRPYTREKPALVRVHRTLKGRSPELIEVGGPGAYGGADCSIALDRNNERRRMILVGGPDLYHLYRDYSDSRGEDRVLKSDRREDWPYFAGDGD